MDILKTTVQTFVSHTVAVTKARLLVEHGRDLRGQFVSVSLSRILRVCAPELFLQKNRRQLNPFGWRICVESWYPFFS